ncbi:MAG: acyl-CoA desaturase [Verrucomicrobia bacterium]|nr:acyl-CoA desaturase [Verrucomicrobiota bacterium]
MLSAVLRWILPPPETFENPVEGQEKVEWFRCIPFILIHLSVIGVLFVNFSWWCVAIAFISYCVRMFAITAFYHRYFSHRAFETNRIVQFLGAFVACSAGQRGPLWWSAHHRRHHKYSDTDLDVHSPKSKSVLWSHALWFMSDYALPTFLREIPDWLKYKELRFINRYDWIPVLTLALFCYWLGETSWAISKLETSGAQLFVWGFLVPTVALYHATFSVNSLAHIFGKRKFETLDESRNNALVSVLTLGEGWHNNHHFFPSSARQGFFKGQFDPTHRILQVLSFFGFVWGLKKSATSVQEKAIS